MIYFRGGSVRGASFTVILQQADLSLRNRLIDQDIAARKGKQDSELAAAQ